MEVREQEDSLQGAARIALVAAVISSLAALLWDARAAAGVAAGAAVSITGLLLLLNVIPRACKTKRPARWLRVMWVVKFPLLCTLLYFLIGKELVSPVAFCFGVGVVPLVLTVSGLWRRSEAA